MDKASGCGLEDCRFESYWAHMNLDTPVNKIPRIGAEYQKKLKRLRIKTMQITLRLLLKIKYCKINIVAN